jgi:Pvc16 N-terminal domain/Carboxypeptidase regulatory-like domain
MMQTAFIDDLSATLKAVLQDPGFAGIFPELAGADVIFDRPSDSLSPAKSTIDLFLYDLRENLDLRLNEVTTTKVGNQIMTHPAQLRLACSYLATAWPMGGVDLALQEQRLLSEVLVVLSHYPTIPASFLQGSLINQDPLLPMVALHPDALKNLAEFWSSLGAKLRASLTVTVTISVPMFSDVENFMVTTQQTGYTQGKPASRETVIQVGGQVIDPIAQVVSGALVDLMDTGQRDVTDDNGRFSFDSVPAGAHTLRAIAVGFKPQTQSVTVPGRPEDYVLTLAPL